MAWGGTTHRVFTFKDRQIAEVLKAMARERLEKAETEIFDLGQFISPIKACLVQPLQPIPAATTVTLRDRDGRRRRKLILGSGLCEIHHRDLWPYDDEDWIQANDGTKRITKVWQHPDDNSLGIIRVYNFTPNTLAPGVLATNIPALDVEFGSGDQDSESIPEESAGLSFSTPSGGGIHPNLNAPSFQNDPVDPVNPTDPPSTIEDRCAPWIYVVRDVFGDFYAVREAEYPCLSSSSSSISSYSSSISSISSFISSISVSASISVSSSVSSVEVSSSVSVSSVVSSVSVSVASSSVSSSVSSSSVSSVSSISPVSSSISSFISESIPSVSGSGVCITCYDGICADDIPVVDSLTDEDYVQALVGGCIVWARTTDCENLSSASGA